VWILLGIHQLNVFEGSRNELSVVDIAVIVNRQHFKQGFDFLLGQPQAKD
jgi:hypothetical protein